ncbi:MAG TPA: hypothetical protein ENL08_03960 [Bacteroidetes bacterium]|nr:hypothetical protein [Bacteroidota bacterium]
MDWSSILTGVVGVVAVPLVLYMIGLLLPRRRTFGWGYRLGKLLTAFGQRRIGPGWERIEDRVKGTVADFVEGIYAGLDADDGGTAPN